MTPPPRVSIVMPVRNAAGVLRPALESILAQTLSSLEFVVIDDGSTDASASVAEDLASRDRRLRVVRQSAAGIVEALNRGLAVARGTYIARMDADDISLPQRLEIQSRHLDNHPDIGLVSCRVCYGGDTGSQAGYAAYVAWANTILTSDDIANTRFIESALPHPSVMFRRELVERFGSYRHGAYPEDYDLWLRWMEAGVKMAKVTEELLLWNDPPERLSRVDARYETDAFFAHKAPFLARWLERHNPFHPDIVVWGAGRTSRRRASLLEDSGVRITAYVDIDPGKIGQRIDGRPVLAPNELPAPGSGFVVSYVGSRGARDLIEKDLVSLGYRPGINCILAA